MVKKVGKRKSSFSGGYPTKTRVFNGQRYYLYTGKGLSMNRTTADVVAARLRESQGWKTRVVKYNDYGEYSIYVKGF